MKKLILTFMAVMTILFVAILMPKTTVNAESLDLYDDEIINPTINQSNQQYTFTNLEPYSEYVVRLVPKGIYDFAQGLAQMNFSIEVLGTDHGSEIVYGNSMVYNQLISNDTITTYEFQTTNTDLWLEIYFWFESWSEADYYNLMGDFTNTFDLQLIHLGYYQVPDTTDPVFTVSETVLNIPYYESVPLEDITALVTATDDVDGNLTSSIQIYEDNYSIYESYQVGGEYYIVYSVSDSANNTAYLTIDINIIDNIKPIFSDGLTDYSDNSTIQLTWYDDEDDRGNNPFTTILQNAQFEDVIHGNVIFMDPTAITNGWSFDHSQGIELFDGSVSGIYNHYIIAVDPSGNSTRINFELTVLENQDPVIDGLSTIDIEIDDISNSYLLSQYYASDTEDGELSLSIVSSDLNTSALGTYTVVLSAVDSFGAETQKTITVNVIDTVLPIIKLNGNLVTAYTKQYNLSETNDIQQLFNLITATDNYDGDLTSSINFPESVNLTTIGTTIYDVTVTDSSGNTRTLELTIVVKDDIAPTFNSTSSSVTGTQLTQLSLTHFESLIDVSDNYDTLGNITIQLYKDEYTANYNVLGTYRVIYSATDSSGNVAFHIFYVDVVNYNAPVFVFDSSLIVVTDNQPITESELQTLLESYGVVVTDLNYTISIIEEDYFANSDQVGLYSMSLRIDYEDNTSDVIQLSFKVVDDMSSEDPSLFGSLTNIQKTLTITISSIMLLSVAFVVYRKKR
jgi:hypothetical protein